MIENVLEIEDEDIEKFDCKIDFPVRTIPTGPCSPPEVQYTGYTLYDLQLILCKKPKSDYEGFCREYMERVEKGFPIDLTILNEMAEKYHTPVPCDEDCQAFRCGECETKSPDKLCDKGGRKVIY